MKNKFAILLIVLFIGLNKTYGAISDKFKFVIDTVGIPRYNSYGEEISEQVYDAYNIFSYSEPQKIVNKEQRFKSSKYGFWTKNGGKYNGKGTRGEYYIIGKSYSGSVIYNYYFPMDVIPNTTPDKWTFYKYPGASKSWEDKSKYKYKEQIEHMKNSKLMFNDISSRKKADNPKYIKEYNITVNKIGTSKARLDTAATWKTYGMISTRRKISGVIYSQVYLVKPMAADAKLNTNILVDNKYILSKEQDKLLIPIQYTSNVENMTGYARKEHIKNINCKLYINKTKVDEISGSKTTSVGNKYMLVVTRDKFAPNKDHCVEIKLESYLHTEFAVDGLIQSEKTKKINIFVEKKPQNPVKNINVMTLEKDTQKWVVRPLAQTNITKSENSVGFSEAGKYIALKIEFTNNNNTEIKSINLDGEKIECEQILKDENVLILALKLKDTLHTTLYGIDSLRNKTSNYFKVDNNELLQRKEEPHKLIVKTQDGDKEFENKILIDTMDNIMSNINMKIDKEDINYLEVNTKMTLKEWINLKNE